jgi:hypothetical protein
MASRDADRADDDLISLALREVRPGPEGRAADLGREVQEPLVEGDRDMRAPRIVGAVEEHQVQSTQVLDVDVREAGVAPEFA